MTVITPPTTDQIPVITERSTFNAKATAFAGVFIPQMVGEINTFNTTLGTLQSSVSADALAASNSAAAAATSETNAATSETNAATSETNAANSAASAATDAATAAADATAAATSETNAANSATAAGLDATRAESARDDAQETTGERNRKDVAALLADTTLTYTAGSSATVTAGDVIRTRAEGFAYSVAASGATDHQVATAGGVKLYVLPLPGNWFMPDQFAENVTPGTTNMTGAVIAAKEKGKVKGSGAVYAVNGVVTLFTGDHLQDIEFKQLAPGSLTAMTLQSTNQDNLTLIRVKVDRNGDGTNGGNTDDADPNWALNTAIGVNLSGGTGHHFEDVEVFGDDSGTLLKFDSLDHTSKIIRPTAHTAFCTRAALVDDVIQGVWVSQCTGLTVENPIAYDLETQPTSGARTALRTRGIIESGNVDVTYLGISVDNVDQGFDATGSAGNLRTRVIGGTVRNAYTNGMKFANSSLDFVCDGVTVYRAGWNGFVAAGPSEAGLTNLTENGVFQNCRAVEVGHSGAYPTTHAFRNERQLDNLDYPKATKFIDCVADCGAGVTSHAFHNNNEPVRGDGPVEVVRPTIKGAPSVGRFTGIHRNVVRVRGDASFPVPNGTFTTLTFNTSMIDDMAAHDTTIDNDRIYLWRDGRYRLYFDPIYWQGNSNGVRQVQFKRNGNDIGLVSLRMVPVTGEDVFYNVSYTTDRFVKGDYVSVSVIQSSGVTLNISLFASAFNVEWIGD